ncbi:MAG: DUF5666 domain-containing protein [Acidobacteriaceae bacterium]
MRFGNIKLSLLLVGALAVSPTLAAHAAQTASATAAPTRIVGSVTAINGQSVTVKPDTGAPVTFTVSDKARILETQPGAKTLAGATPIQLSGIAVGDRVLAALQPTADGSTATTLIAMKKAALAQHQQAEEADWQRRGVGGLVKAVNPATGTVTIASGSRTLTIRTTPSTIVRRYSPDSIEFSDTRPSSLAEIQPGDQLRAKGNHSADGGEVTADEIVAGSFRNIAGTVQKIDEAANTVTVRDLATKKPVVIHITAESRMHKLPEPMAKSLAVILKRDGDHHREQHPAAESGNHHGQPQPGGQQHSGDLSQMLQRTPTVQLSELHKGDAVMIVATKGTPGSATAVTLLAGVEPVLTASPSASQSMFSASWSVGGGGGGGGDTSSAATGGGDTGGGTTSQ